MKTSGRDSSLGSGLHLRLLTNTSQGTQRYMSTRRPLRAFYPDTIPFRPGCPPPIYFPEPTRKETEITHRIGNCTSPGFSDLNL
ncbi:uncharacterized protein CLUP02_10934 [Colletotrichum lupini]|uniref:Uncharacterized protein n=1 Tax=Colletotrichum lupini TaxID=145971 RepID=A0A9Q8SZB4_9PEZI|nr:uncharacterized protein CLUP02_10934 [Colletotrichum lupini]UQC85436.1 hypothetical protein CLUP02_10934 [Colletotrichum lupini]